MAGYFIGSQLYRDVKVPSSWSPVGYVFVRCCDHRQLIHKGRKP